MILHPTRSVLALDLSTKAIGWAALTPGSAPVAGSGTTILAPKKKAVPLALRLQAARTEIGHLLAEWTVAWLAIERGFELHGDRELPMVEGIARLVWADHRGPEAEPLMYSPAAVRSHIGVVNRRCIIPEHLAAPQRCKCKGDLKERVRARIDAIASVNARTDDEADAIAVGLRALVDTEKTLEEPF